MCPQGAWLGVLGRLRNIAAIKTCGVSACGLVCVSEQSRRFPGTPAYVTSPGPEARREPGSARGRSAVAVGAATL